MPWCSRRGQDNDGGETVQCVDVRSSMPLPEALTLSSGSDFSRVVRELLLQDLALLPVSDPSTQYVERGNVSVYTEGEHVLLVYAPSSLMPSQAGGRLEFVSFAIHRSAPL